MDLVELARKKSEVEEKITKLLTSLEEETGDYIQVQSLEIKRRDIGGNHSKKSLISSVKVCISFD